VVGAVGTGTGLSGRLKKVGHMRQDRALAARQVAVMLVLDVVVAVGPTEVVELDDLETVGPGVLEVEAVGWTLAPAAAPVWPEVVYAKAAVKPPSNSSNAAAVIICVFVEGTFIFLRGWVGRDRIYCSASRNWNS
jgi:hypothetical protein